MRLASQRIIKNLKAELKSRDNLLQQLKEKEERIQQLEGDADLMETKIERLLRDHAVLSAKLETARNHARSLHVGNKPATAGPFSGKDTWQHKEHLISDLCGLIIINVRNDDDGGVEYDCLSSGKNGGMLEVLYSSEIKNEWPGLTMRSIHSTPF